MATIRYARPGDENRVRELWEQGFGDEGPEYTQWYFSRVYQPQRTLVLEGAQGIASCLQMAPYSIQLNGEPCRAAYIVGLVTDEQQRHLGYGRLLLEEAMQQLKASGYKMVMLYTDIPDFYIPSGFIHCYQMRKWHLRSLKAPGLKDWRQVEPGREAILHCRDIYRRMTQGLNGYVLRSPENWRIFLEDPSNTKGGIWLGRQAYFLWLEENGEFILRELGFANAAGMEQGLAQARSLAGDLDYPRITWLAPMAVPPRIPQQTVQPFVMCRRLDLPEELTIAEIAAMTHQLYEKTPGLYWVNEYV